MSDDATQIDTLMLKAARLRCEGATWDAVAAAVGRSVDTVRHWPLTRPTDWYPALQKAIDECMPECEREALHVLRQGLRDKKPDEKRKSAAALLRHRRECRAKLLTIGGVDGGGGLQIVITPAVKPEEGEAT